MGDNVAFHSADRNVRYSDYIIYADESGNPNPVSIDANYPVFVLNFCLFRKDDYTSSVLPALTRFKFENFGHDAVVFHEQDIYRGKEPFDFAGDAQLQTTFRHGLNEIVARLDFGIIAVVVNLRELSQQKDPDAYTPALRLCMEQAYIHLGKAGQQGAITHIVLEGRGRREDADLMRKFGKVRDGSGGLGKVMPEFQMVLVDKKSNSVGLQMADLTAYSVGRRHLAPHRPNWVWETVVRPKLISGPTVFP